MILMLNFFVPCRLKNLCVANQFEGLDTRLFLVFAVHCLDLQEGKREKNGRRNCG